PAPFPVIRLTKGYSHVHANGPAPVHMNAPAEMDNIDHIFEPPSERFISENLRMQLQSARVQKLEREKRKREEDRKERWEIAQTELTNLWILAGRSPPNKTRCHSYPGAPIYYHILSVSLYLIIFCQLSEPKILVPSVHLNWALDKSHGQVFRDVYKSLMLPLVLRTRFVGVFYQVQPMGKIATAGKTTSTLVHLPRTEGALEEFLEGGSLAIIWNFMSHLEQQGLRLLRAKERFKVTQEKARLANTLTRPSKSAP
ncbi:hypothetical protein BGZ76_006061, partial [Entomortierella beljakovae]